MRIPPDTASTTWNFFSTILRIRFSWFTAPQRWLIVDCRLMIDAVFDGSFGAAVGAAFYLFVCETLDIWNIDVGNGKAGNTHTHASEHSENISPFSSRFRPIEFPLVAYASEKRESTNLIYDAPENRLKQKPTFVRFIRFNCVVCDNVTETWDVNWILFRHLNLA